jgi:hypothetical protein
MSSTPRRQNTTYHHVEHTVYNSWRGSTITRGTVASYHRARGSLQPYPSKDVILARGRNFRGEDHDNRDLWFGDMIFANAVAADYRLRDEHCANFKPLIAHIERGIDDRTGDDNTGRNLFEERAIRYAAGGDVMLMSYCNVLNKEVRRTSPIVISD